MAIATPTPARRPATRPQPAARADARRVVARTRRTSLRATPQPTMRERVETAFRAQANGAPAAQAQSATSEFYRSSGFNWARYLG